MRPPQGNGRSGSRRSRPLVRGDRPRRYTNASAKPRLLESALAAAEDCGYQALRIVDITDPVGVQRQAFYAHFGDKRHCLCEAVDPKLAVVERAASAASDDQAEWAAQILRAVDEILDQRFGSLDGTKGRLVAALKKMLRLKGSLGAVKVSDLVKEAHVPQEDFYKYFSGKKDCFALLYRAELDALAGKVRATEGGTARSVLAALRAALCADEARRVLLVHGIADLAEAPSEHRCAWQGSLVETVEGLLAPVLPNGSPRFYAAAAVEITRAAVIDDGAEAGALYGLLGLEEIFGCSLPGGILPSAPTR